MVNRAWHVGPGRWSGRAPLQELPKISELSEQFHETERFSERILRDERIFSIPFQRHGGYFEALLFWKYVKERKDTF